MLDVAGVESVGSIPPNLGENGSPRIPPICGIYPFVMLAPLGEGAFVQADGCRGGEVHRFGVPVERHGDRPVDLGEVFVGQPAGLVAEEPGGGRGEQAAVARGEQVVALDVGREELEAGGLHPAPDVFEGGADGDRQVEDRARGGADDLGVVQVDAAAGEDDRVRAGGIRCPDDRAGVAGIAHLFEDGDEPGLFREDVLTGIPFFLAHSMHKDIVSVFPFSIFDVNIIAIFFLHTSHNFI